MNKMIKTNVVSIVFGISCIALYLFLPTNLTIEIFIGTAIFLLALPLLYTKIILHKNYSDVGFTSMTIDMQTGFYLVSSIVIGGFLSFVIVSLGWGTEAYKETLSTVILKNFSVFILYELLFTTGILFLFTFFVWGFIYSINWGNKIYSYMTSFILFIVMLIELYSSAWVILPLLVPTFFITKIRDKKNITYLFIAFFVIALILDTLIVKKFS